MTQTLPLPDLDDFRVRVDADPVYAPDTVLQSYLDQAAVVVGNELPDDGDFTLAPNVLEALVQVAVKLWDLRARGVGSQDLAGDVAPSALPATSGLVKSVRGLLLPSMPTGGVTV